MPRTVRVESTGLLPAPPAGGALPSRWCDVKQADGGRSASITHSGIPASLSSPLAQSYRSW
jgi:hypothetical protein